MMHLLRLASFTIVASMLPACQGFVDSDAQVGTGPTSGGSFGGASSTGGPGSPNGTSCAVLEPKLIDLTPEQFEQTVLAVFPGVDASTVVPKLDVTYARSGRFRHDAGVSRMSTPHVSALLDLSWPLADGIVKKLQGGASCLVAPEVTAACAEDYLKELLPRAFRRPTDASEVAAYGALHARELTMSDAPRAARVLHRSILLSPHFLNRTEIGSDAGVQLTASERASAIAYSITESPPDAELRAAAASGALDEPNGLAAQVERLLAAPDNAPGVERLMREVLRFDLVRGSFKAADRYSDFSEGTGDAMAHEAALFVRHVLWQEPESVKALLSAPYSFVNAKLASLYGVPAPGVEWAQVTLPAERAGLLTQLSLMTALANDQEAHLVMRGHYVQQNLLCGTVPDPPKELEINPVIDDGTRTNRELYAAHTQGNCASCHQLMDPLGYPLEQFDAIGRYRTTQNGKPIDTSAQYGNLSFVDAKDLATQLASSEQVRSCFAAHIAEFVTSGASRDSCVTRELRADVATQNGSLLDMLKAALTNPAFTTRVTEKTAQ